eukprot:6964984-Alexandrium_andersonii.AAC.1
MESGRTWPTAYNAYSRTVARDARERACGHQRPALHAVPACEGADAARHGADGADGQEAADSALAALLAPTGLSRRTARGQQRYVNALGDPPTHCVMGLELLAA